MARYSPRIARLYVREAPYRCRLLVSWWASDEWTFGAIKSSWRGSFGRHSDAVWSPADKAWSVPAYRRRAVEDWAASLFAIDAIIWAGDEDDGDWDEGPARTAHTGTALQTAYQRLYLREDAPTWAAEAVYRAAAKQYHSDVGGDDRTMAALNQSIAVIREEASHARAS